jgi:mRNA interferase YafQ
MYKVQYSTKFRRDLRKFEKDSNFKTKWLKDILWLLVKNKPLDGRYRNHKLKNKFHDCMECHIKPDLLLIYSVDNNKKEIYLYRLGSHSELFG